jgi:hypothetical protein
MFYARTSFLLALSLWLSAACLAQGPLLGSQRNEPNVTEEQQKEFLLNAKVVGSKQLGKGITHPWRLTLSDGNLTHDAAFQPVDEHKQEMQFVDGRTEFNFVDSYHYDIAGYELAKLVGMSDMIPVTVERKWNGQMGALSWWIPWKWDEGMRRQQNMDPPDTNDWNKQMNKIRVFDQLVFDTDANLTNILITENWKIWRIDFTRAFRLSHELQSPTDLIMCDRELLASLRKLNANEVLQRTKPHLTALEIQGIIVRRDKIVTRFQQLISQKGEAAVLY